MKQTVHTIAICFCLCLSSTVLRAQEQSSISEHRFESAISLSQVLEFALKNNPELQAAASDVARVHGEIVTAGTWQNPELSLGPAIKRVPGSGGEPDDNSFKGNLELTQLIEFPGKRSLRIALAEKDRAIGQLALEGLQHQIRFKVEKSFYSLLAIQELLKLRAEQVKSAEIFAEAARKRAKGGFGSDLDVIKGDADQISAQKLLRENEAKLVTAKAQLNALMGRNVREQFEATGSIEALGSGTFMSSSVEFALAHNPTLRAEELRAKKAGLAVEAARLDRAPDLTVGPFVEHSTDEQVYGFGVSLPLPFWDQKGGRIESARAERSKSLSEITRLSLEISEAVVSASARLEASYSQLKLYSDDFFKRLKSGVEQAQRSYEASGTTLLLYLDAKRTYFDSLADYYETLNEVAEAHADLSSAVGVPLNQP